MALINVIRTQFRLDRHEYFLARKEAKRLGISFAEFVRRAIREKLPDEHRSWMRYAGLIESGDAQSSRHIDEILYGTRD
jgi:hypothetical protein